MPEAVSLQSLSCNCRVNQQDATAGDSLVEGIQPDPAWLAARRQAMRVHVGYWHLSYVHSAAAVQAAAVINALCCETKFATRCCVLQFTAGAYVLTRA